MAMALTACLYYLIPKKYQWELLLFVSFGFYATYGIRYMGYILFTIITSYCITRLMAAQKEKLMRRRWLIFGLVSNFGILVFLKYVNFTILNLTSLFSVFHQAFPLGKLSIVMPLGISFYTFQTMSYVIDVYQKKYEPETNIFRLALFTAYLPQLLQGPIGRYDRLAPQLFEPHDFNLKNIEYGAQRIAWGLAKKLILADRAYVFSKAVFADLNTYSGMYVIVALLTFSIYEYCDFSGGIDIVIGTAEIFGIRMDENFRQPFFSKSIGEFWRRWHITLGTWMKDYIFYPFSLSKQMNRFGKWSKKHLGNTVGKAMPICLADLLIFFVVGIWHGAAWKYIAYGMYNGIIIAVSSLLEPLYAKGFEKTKIHKESKAWTVVQIIRTFILVNIGWYFDMAVSFSAALVMMKETFTKMSMSQFTGTAFLELGMGRRDFLIVLAGCIIIFIVSLLKERGVAVREAIAAKPLIVRWAIWYAFIVIIFIFAYTGDGSAFIYANF